MADMNEKLPEESVETEAKADKKTKQKGPGFFARLGGKIKKFFRDYTSEMRKVVWLSRKETIKSSVLVVVSVIVLCILIGLVDTGLEYGVTGLWNLTR